ncbi:hypothetical protein CLM62_36390 [Streptomyces sp. SA15]|nr:hypothetical protein CLM62_36390 [Streptomyces sp. SA15]
MADPAFACADDESQPAPGEWSAGLASRGGAETGAEAASCDQATFVLATKDTAFMERTVTFKARLQTVRR